jgi:hypothetical protein
MKTRLISRLFDYCFYDCPFKDNEFNCFCPDTCVLSYIFWLDNMYDDMILLFKYPDLWDTNPFLDIDFQYYEILE